MRSFDPQHISETYEMQVIQLAQNAVTLHICIDVYLNSTSWVVLDYLTSLSPKPARGTMGDAVVIMRTTWMQNR